MKFKLIPTITVTITFLILVALGLWQVQRLKEKTQMIDYINQQIEQQPESLDTANGVSLYKKYLLKGRFVNGSDLFLYGNNFSKPPRAGYHILTPFLTTNGDYILVNRGWSQDKEAKAASGKEIEIVGVAMQPQNKNIFLPKNQPEKNLWIFVNLQEIADHTGVPIKNKFYITMIDGEGELLLPSAKDFTRLRNTHLSYAITWLSLAAALLVIAYIRAKNSGDSTT